MSPKAVKRVPAPEPGLVRELDTALSTVTSFQGAVQHADEKVRTVVAVQSTITALVAAQLAFLPAAQPAAGLRTAVFAILACFVAGYGYSAFQLVQALRPRTERLAVPNRFAFPTVAGAAGPPARAPVRRQCAEAHQLSRLLAELAMVKHRHVRRALAGTGVLFLCGPLLLLVTALA
ncbi:hypothetical protein [Amycolatopsis vancoresmycina]|uniref:Pycsar effector protein domain-containing protein n=1 Tax=Amycolatopsis vancoresmycina DSM 44592 TaxID=1292037 RepID=R1HZ96_9PSEU|nr:hypothetical protein [Amycolatopsis vancoresmycina]EOD65626.1 hypothetical protein H480_25665 [Amycolatopsis vancoresmycina DSM 44592]